MPALERLRQKHSMLGASLGYIVRHIPKTHRQKKKERKGQEGEEWGRAAL